MLRTGQRTALPSASARWRSLATRLGAWRLPAPPNSSRAQRPLPWRALLARAASLWLATRLAYLALTLAFPLVTGGDGGSAAISTAPVSLAALARRWTQWDGANFLHIAQAGYTDRVLSVFFPLYPALVRVIVALIGPHWAAAGLLASGLSALLAFVGVAALAAQVAPDGRELEYAQIALLLFAAYPLAFFFTATYSDGLFAGLAAFALLCALRRRWGWAALCGALAALCRPVAPALILPLAWEALQWYRARRSQGVGLRAPGELRARATALLAVASPALGLAGYSAWLWARFGDPLAYAHAESHWAHLTLSPLISVPVAILASFQIPTGSPLQARVALDLAPVLVAIVVTALAARRAPLAFTLYLLGLLLLVTSEPLNYRDLFVSGGRYLLAAAPLFVIVGGWLARSRWLLPALACVLATLQAALALFFLAHGWIV